MTAPFDTDLWRRRVVLRKDGLSISEIARREGIRPQSIAKGFQRMRSMGMDVPRDSNVGRPPEVQVVEVDHETFRAMRRVALARGMTTNKVARQILRTAVIEHPQIALNILDPEA